VAVRGWPLSHVREDCVTSGRTPVRQPRHLLAVALVLLALAAVLGAVLVWVNLH
jgi:hypothetical protein